MNHQNGTVLIADKSLDANLEKLLSHKVSKAKKGVRLTLLPDQMASRSELSQIHFFVRR